SKDFVSNHIANLFPFCELLGRLTPSTKPENWPQLDEVEDKAPLPSQADLDNYLTDLACGEQVILCANGPVLRQMSGVNCDLEIKAVFLKSEYDGDVKALYLLLTGQDTSLEVN